MSERTTVKGHLAHLAARLATLRWLRRPAELLLVSAGHRYPANRWVIALCRHFVDGLIHREGPAFRRTAVFGSGGRMDCGGAEAVARASAMYYFLGTITGQDEDERPVLNLLSRALTAGDTFFDVGANLGFYSIYLGPICGTQGVVHAFEANPLLIDHLTRSSALNRHISNIVTNSVAVGDQDGAILELYDPARIGGSSLYRLDWLDPGQTVTVTTTSLDAYIAQNAVTKIDVLKIDIEGAELAAFRGLTRTLAVMPPWLIVCELALLIDPERPSHTQATRGRYARQLVDFLAAHHYDAHVIEDTTGLLGPSLDADALPRVTQNLLNVAFVHRERGRDMRQRLLL